MKIWTPDWKLAEKVDERLFFRRLMGIQERMVFDSGCNVTDESVWGVEVMQKLDFRLLDEAGMLEHALGG